MDKRYILALVLMSIVMVIWMVVQSKVTPPPPARNQQATESPVQKTERDKVGKDEVADEIVRDEVVSEGNSTEFRQDMGSPIAHVKTNYYEAEITNHATISSWKLNKYKSRDKKNGALVDLIPRSSLARNYLAIELISENIINWSPVDKTSITLTENNQEQGSITFKGDIEGTSFSVAKEYTFYKDSYIVDVDITFENLSSERKVFDGYKLNWGAGISADKEKPDGNSGAIVCFLDEKGKKKAKKDLKDEVASGEQLIWAGLSNKYFSAVIIPATSIKAQYNRLTLEAKSEVPYVAKPAGIVKLEVPQFVLAADESKVHSFQLYAGPKDRRELKQIQLPQTGEPARLDLLVNFGIFSPLSKMMLWLLNGIYSFIGNYGVSIIIVTTLLKAILYPLTMKSHKSMSKMQQLKEPLAELKEKYRDNPQELKEGKRASQWES